MTNPSVRSIVVPADVDNRKRSWPVIRIWGPTAAGQRACVHVHGFLPYFYARPANTSSSHFARLFHGNGQTLQAHLPNLQRDIEKNLAAALKKAEYAAAAEKSGDAAQQAGEERPRGDPEPEVRGPVGAAAVGGICMKL